MKDVADDGDGDAARVSPERPDAWSRCDRMVRRSSSAWVGCSCIPSPALGWQPRRFFERPRRARRVVAEDDGFSAERTQCEAGVFQRFTFFDA